MKIAVLITSFNRVGVTLLGLKGLYSAFEKIRDVELFVVLVDDKSSDDTVDSVRLNFPQTLVIEGGGDLYWAGGMRKAYEVARSNGCFDAYLLFNDDVSLIDDGVQGIIKYWLELDKLSCPILVGAMHDGKGVTTYSGYRKTSKIKPRGCEFVDVDLNGVVDIDMPNANFLLVDALYFDGVKGLAREYSHSLADMSLGLAAKKGGRRVLLYNKFVGVCQRNKTNAVILKNKNLIESLRFFKGVKNGPNDYIAFCIEHYPKLLLPIYIIGFWAKVIALIFKTR